MTKVVVRGPGGTFYVSEGPIECMFYGTWGQFDNDIPKSSVTDDDGMFQVQSLGNFGTDRMKPITTLNVATLIESLAQQASTNNPKRPPTQVHLSPYAATCLFLQGGLNVGHFQQNVIATPNHIQVVGIQIGDLLQDVRIVRITDKLLDVKLVDKDGNPIQG